MRILFTAMLASLLFGCDQSATETVTDAPATTPDAKEASSGGLVLPKGYDAAEQTIQAPMLLKDVSRIAGDEFQGRGAGSEGDRNARAFLAGRLVEMGYEPFFEGGSFEGSNFHRSTFYPSTLCSLHLSTFRSFNFQRSTFLSLTKIAERVQE